MDNKDWIGVDTFYFSKWLTVPAYVLQTLRGYCFKYRNPRGKGEFPLHNSTVLRFFGPQEPESLHLGEQSEML